MKSEEIKINRVKFITLLHLFLIQLTFISSNLNSAEFDSKENRVPDLSFNGNGVNFPYNNSRLFNNNIRFLAETVKDKYQNVKDNDLAAYSHSSRSQEFFIDDYLIQLTTSFNEEKVLDGTYKNLFDISIIDLDDCKEKIYTDNTIDNTLPLIIIKLEKKTELFYDKNIQFEVYNPSTKKIIDLSTCQSINLYLPIYLNNKTETLQESLLKDKYNLLDMNGPFYQDICTPYKTKNNSDITLSDRRKYYFIQEFAPQSNCEFSNYTSENNLIQFKCKPDKEGINIENLNKYNGEQALTDFNVTIKNLNLIVLKCTKLVFNPNSMTKNFGCLILIILVVVNIILLVVFIIKGISPLRLYIAKFIFERPKNKHYSNKDIKTEINFPPRKKKAKTTIRKKAKFKDLDDNSEIDEDKENKNNKETEKNEEKDENKKNKGKDEGDENDVEEIKENNSQDFARNRNKKKTKSLRKKSSKTANNYVRKGKKSKTSVTNKVALESKNDIIESKEDINNQQGKNNENNLEPYELNYMELDKAITLDKRSFCQTYLSIIKREHIIFFTFFSWNDYNLVYIKFARFFFLISTNIAMNVFFFFDNSLNKLFLEQGKFDFISFFLQVILSTIVSHILEVIICYLTMTDKFVYQIKELENNENNRNMVMKTIKCIRIKLIVFFILILVFMVFYWYLVTAFCAVYENTQTILLINSLASFFLYLAYPFLTYLLASTFRYIGLKNNSSCIYKFGNIIPIF